MSRDNYSVTLPPNWELSSASSPNFIRLKHTKHPWEFSMMVQENPLPSLVTKKRLTSDRWTKIRKVRKLTIQGREGYVIELLHTKRGVRRVFKTAYMPDLGPRHFTFSFICPADDFEMIRKDRVALIRSIELNLSKKPSPRRKKRRPASIAKANFTATLAPDWYLGDNVPTNSNHLELAYQVHGASGSLHIYHEDFPPVGLSKIVPKQEKALARSKVTLGKRSGVKGVSVDDTFRFHRYELDNNRGGRFRIEFKCEKSDYPKVKSGLQRALKGLEFF